MIYTEPRAACTIVSSYVPCKTCAISNPNSNKLSIIIILENSSSIREREKSSYWSRHKTEA